ncbi:chemotaxis protein CheB [Sphingomonas sp.]|jgi:two-component system chemotaxis response regulator CheB|uniref:chemotaxis protein CheB n=1 Tax=Sphingomonas sp. TaxID=28214 RepID=UPI002D80A6DA|nr:chemotaxis protein CheB [Sphingomonas sp.]HEU0043561.1 chemotaxis protein CheB [Sphingomonas sp.]
MRHAALRAVAAGDLSSILIVDDSAVARAVMSRVVDGSGRYAVTGAVSNVGAALAFLARSRVDYILLDIHLPGVDGITALPDLLAAGGDAKVLIVSSSAEDGAVQAVQALALGAADTMAKPEGLSTRFGQTLLEKLDRLGEAAPIASAPPAPLPTSRRSEVYELVAIAASTGGIHALSRLLRELPASFLLPVLITQHLPTTFMHYFAAQLAALTGRACDVATDRLRIRPGRLIVAPGDAHVCVMRLTDGGTCIRLSKVAAASGCMPSADPMFASVAATFGPHAIGVVLSGMGRDGADGARALREAGAAVVVQDRDSSVVWGMPGAVAALGLAEAVLPPDAIGRLLAERRRP